MTVKLRILVRRRGCSGAFATAEARVGELQSEGLLAVMRGFVGVVQRCVGLRMREEVGDEE